MSPSSPRPALGWETFPHGSDIGVRGFGPTRERAFEQAALALTAVVTEPETVAAVDVVGVRCEGSDDELLLYDWLNAIVYSMATRRMLFARFEVELDRRGLSGQLVGETVDPHRHRPAVEVKGATFTELAVVEEDDGWCAQCVVDV